MPSRAPSPCSYPGCGALATTRGRCDDHPHPHRWGTRRPRQRERYGVSPGAWNHLKRAVFARDGSRCTRCGAPATTVDHVMPIAEGGAGADLDNLAAICGACHDTKTRAEIARSNTRRARRREHR